MENMMFSYRIKEKAKWKVKFIYLFPFQDENEGKFFHLLI